MSIQRFLASIFVAMLTLTTGCSPVRIYDGPPRSSDQVATIKGSIFFYGIAFQSVGVSALDDTALDRVIAEDGRDFEVLPGQHKLTTRVTFARLGAHESREYAMNVALEAGKSYELDFITQTGWIIVSLTEEDTGREVGRSVGMQPFPTG